MWGKDTWLGRLKRPWHRDTKGSPEGQWHSHGTWSWLHILARRDKESDLYICLLNSLNLYFSFSILLSIRLKKMNATKSEHLNSAHMTFPSHLITSIQFTSASHARPQSIKHAPWQRCSCPIITPIIKVQELWVKPSWLMDETNRFLNSFEQAPDQKQTKAGHSNIMLKNKGRQHCKRSSLCLQPPAASCGLPWGASMPAYLKTRSVFKVFRYE